jgi:hypothetical protein
VLGADAVDPGVKLGRIDVKASVEFGAGLDDRLGLQASRRCFSISVSGSGVPSPSFGVGFITPNETVIAEFRDPEDR